MSIYAKLSCKVAGQVTVENKKLKTTNSGKAQDEIDDLLKKLNKEKTYEYSLMEIIIK